MLRPLVQPKLGAGSRIQTVSNGLHLLATGGPKLGEFAMIVGELGSLRGFLEGTSGEISPTHWRNTPIANVICNDTGAVAAEFGSIADFQIPGVNALGVNFKEFSVELPWDPPSTSYLGNDARVFAYLDARVGQRILINIYEVN